MTSVPTMVSVPTMMKAGKGKGVIQAGRRRARELRRVLHQFHIELGVWPSPVFKTQDQTIIDLDLDRPPKKRYTCYGSELDRGRMESFSCFPENNFAHLFLHLFTLTITDQQSDQTSPGLDQSVQTRPDQTRPDQTRPDQTPVWAVEARCDQK